MCITITRDVGAPRSSFRTRRRPARSPPPAHSCAVRTAVRPRVFRRRVAVRRPRRSRSRSLSFSLVSSLLLVQTSSSNARGALTRRPPWVPRKPPSRAPAWPPWRGGVSLHTPPPGFCAWRGPHRRRRRPPPRPGDTGRGWTRGWAPAPRGEGRLGLGLGDVDRGLGGALRRVGLRPVALVHLRGGGRVGHVGGGSGRGCGTVRDDGGGRLGGVGGGGVGRVRGGGGGGGSLERLRSGLKRERRVR